jgi:hypothetical protein
MSTSVETWPFLAPCDIGLYAIADHDRRPSLELDYLLLLPLLSVGFVACGGTQGESRTKEEPDRPIVSGGSGGEKQKKSLND